MTHPILQRAFACLLVAGLFLPAAHGPGRAEHLPAPPGAACRSAIDRIDSSRFPRLEASISLAVGREARLPHVSGRRT